MKDSCHFYGSLIILSSLVILCQAKTYTFGEDCYVFLEDIDEDDEVYVRYDGRHVPSYCNDISFSGRGDEILDNYKVCVTPVYYDDPDCSIEIEYTNTVYGDPRQTYTCTDKPTDKYCGDSEDYFYIYLKTKSSDTSDARFKLKVEAVKTYNYGRTVGIIVGCVIGGLVVLGIIIGIVICIACRQKRSPGQVLNPTSGGTVPITQFNQQTTGYSNQQYGMNQLTASQTPQQFSSYPTQFSGSYPTQQTGSNPAPSAPFSSFTNNEPPSYHQATGSEPTKI